MDLGPVMTIMSKRDFNQHSEKAEQLASSGPVFIENNGETAHVLLSIEDYNRLASRPKSLPELLGVADDLDFEPEKMEDFVPRLPEFD